MFKRVASKYWDDASEADLWELELLSERKPPYPAGSLSEVVSFDRMVEEASYHLFGKNTRDGHSFGEVERPDFGSVPPYDEVLERDHAKMFFDGYRSGLCIKCKTRIKFANLEGELGRENHRVLRYLLGLFDRMGEPIPIELRTWSEESRFLDSPPRPQSTPNRNWIRDRCITFTVATLAYMTGKAPTRNKEAKKKRSCCDAVARAFNENGKRGVGFTLIQDVWTKSASDEVLQGPSLLKRWREQDRRETKALTAEQRKERQAQAEWYWSRLPHMRQQPMQTNEFNVGA